MAASGSRRIGSALATLSVVGLLLTATVMGRHLWFFSDDWNILTHYHRGHLLDPFNGHLSLLPAGTYQLLFHTVGLGSYWPYRLVGLVGVALLGWLSYCYAAPRVGGIAAALATTVIIWGSGGVTNVMFPLLVNFSLPIAMLCGSWILLDRDTARADVGASACLAVGLATSGLGVLAMGAIGVELLISRAPLRRWATFAPPVALWFAWYVTHQIAAPGSHGIRSVASYAVHMMWGGTTALAAGWKPGGVIIGILFVAVVVVAGVRWHSLDARSIGAILAPFLFAGLTAFTRLHVVPAIAPDEYRYRWTVAAGLVLAVVSMWRREPLPEWLPGWAVPATGVAALVVVGIGGGVLVRDIRNWDDTVVTAAPGLQADLFAVEAVGSRLDQDHVLPLSYVPVTVGAYRRAVADVGSPLAGRDAATFGGDEPHRETADALFASAVSRRGLPTDPTGCVPYGGGRVEPGRLIGVDAPPASGIRLARFSTAGAPVRTETIDGTRWFRIPRDSPAAPRGGPAYRVEVAGSWTGRSCP